jgi:hypothetical protein
MRFALHGELITSTYHSRPGQLQDITALPDIDMFILLIMAGPLIKYLDIDIKAAARCDARLTQIGSYDWLAGLESNRFDPW